MAAVKSFPGTLIDGPFHFTSVSFFEADPPARDVPVVDFAAPAVPRAGA